MTLHPFAGLPSQGQREDVLVSVCFGELPANEESFAKIATLAAALDTSFRFSEIIVMVSESSQGAYHSLLRCHKNLRLLAVRDGTAFYRQRAIAADEAIGDVVMLASVTELSCIDTIGMIRRAADEQRAVLATRASPARNGVLGYMVAVLGRIAGFKVSLRDLQTLALPRTLLNQLLAHPDPDLALRFPPRDARLPIVFVEAAADPAAARTPGIRRRVALLQKLLVYMAPSLLMAVTITASLLAVIGFCYGLYALGVWLVLDSVAAGWLTLSGILSVTMCFLGLSITGLSLGLQHLISLREKDGFDGVTTELNRIDMFGKVASDLNVALEREPTHSMTVPPR